MRAGVKGLVTSTDVRIRLLHATLSLAHIHPQPRAPREKMELSHFVAPVLLLLPPLRGDSADIQGADREVD